jgi:hypothetical protein
VSGVEQSFACCNLEALGRFSVFCVIMSHITVILQLLKCNMQGNTTPGSTLKVDISKYSGG